MGFPMRTNLGPSSWGRSSKSGNWGVGVPPKPLPPEVEKLLSSKGKTVDQRVRDAHKVGVAAAGARQWVGLDNRQAGRFTLLTDRMYEINKTAHKRKLSLDEKHNFCHLARSVARIVAK